MKAKKCNFNTAALSLIVSTCIGAANGSNHNLPVQSIHYNDLSHTQLSSLVHSHRKTNIIIIGNRAIGSILNTDFSYAILENLDVSKYAVQNVTIDFSSIKGSNAVYKYIVRDKISSILSHVPNSLFILTNSISYDVYTEMLLKNDRVPKTFFYIDSATISQLLHEDIDKVISILEVGGINQAPLIILSDGSPYSYSYSASISAAIREHSDNVGHISKVSIVQIKSINHLRKFLTTIKEPNSVIVNTMFSLDDDTIGIGITRVGEVLTGLNYKFIDIGMQENGEESISLGINIHKTVNSWSKSIITGVGPTSLRLYPSVTLDIRRLKKLGKESIYMNIFDININEFKIR